MNPHAVPEPPHGHRRPSSSFPHKARAQRGLLTTLTLLVALFVGFGAQTAHAQGGNYVSVPITSPFGPTATLLPQSGEGDDVRVIDVGAWGELRVTMGIVDFNENAMFRARTAVVTVAAGATGSVAVNYRTSPTTVGSVTVTLAYDMDAETLTVTLPEATISGPGSNNNLAGINSLSVEGRSPNAAPTATGTVDPVTTTAGGPEAERDVAGSFSDPGDTLTYAAASANTAIATVAVEDSVVTITPVAAGSTTVTVTATDTASQTAMQSITVTIGAVPATTVRFQFRDYSVDEDSADGNAEICAISSLLPPFPFDVTFRLDEATATEPWKAI